MDISNEYKKNLYVVSLILLSILSIYFAVKTFYEVRSEGMTNDVILNTITVSGHGEVSAAPDVATINFTLRGEAKTVKEAQEKVALTETAALEVLRANNIADADIKTTRASFNPKYEYVYSAATSFRPGRSVITGYEAYETINVKIRDIDAAGQIMSELGATGVSELNGPNFEIDKPEGLKAEARQEAIAMAKEKARALAADLGVRLGDLSSFYEQEQGLYPMMYDGAAMNMSKSESAVRAELPQGENTITSDVSITYEIHSTKV